MWQMWMRPGSDLSVGFRDLDESHRAVFALFEEVYAEVFAGPGQVAAELPRRVERLFGALREHFRLEEALMDSHGYPDRLLHRAEHDAFREEMDFVARATREGQLTPALVGRIASEAPAWVEAHIRTHDVPLGRFLQAEHSRRPSARPDAIRRAARAKPR